MDADPVYRAPMRSRRDDIPAGAAVERALTHELCGIGGVLAVPPGSLECAIRDMQSSHGDRAAGRLERFASVDNGAYVWTRDGSGELWLGRIVGTWEYDARAGAEEVDLVHVRNCTWLPEPVAPNRVPPATLETFDRGGRNFQRTHHPAVGAQTEEVWEESISR